MNTNDVKIHFAYDQWANQRLLGAAAQLTSEELFRDLGASFGSVQGTLLHIMSGEMRWLSFWLDGSILPDPTLNEFPNVSSLQEAWSRVEQERMAFASHVGEEQLGARLTVREQDFALGELIEHVLNHSTYHRGQVVLLLKQLHQVPPATDYRLFLSETR